MDIRITPVEVRPGRYPWEEPGWADDAVRSPRQIDAALDALGVDRLRVTEDLTRRLGELAVRFPKDFAPYDEHGPPRPEALAHWVDAIKGWITGLKVVEEEAAVFTREVPLFIFDCPKTPMAKTTYLESESGGVTAGWSIEVFGTGYGSDITVTVTQSNKFVASAGDRKLVFAPLRVRVVKAALLKRGVVQDRFIKAELAETEARDANGVRTVPDAEWTALVDAGRLEERFDLSGDRSGEVATFTRGYELSGTFELKLGLKAFDLESSVKVKCTASQKAEMTFELPAGRKYELRSPASLAGFFFKP